MNSGDCPANRAPRLLQAEPGAERPTSLPNTPCGTLPVHLDTTETDCRQNITDTRSIAQAA